ncbi:MAG: metalloregulator ArsR/SmtB family transcription factor [Pirellulales bacterium]
MVKYSAAPLDRTFSALADPIRRSILARLQDGSATVTELAKPFRVSLPAISRHLRVLECAGLVRRTREGRIHRLRLVARPIGEAAGWIEAYRRFWEGQFDSLGNYIRTLDKKKGRLK